jgi:hypothetical protein
MGMLVFSEIDYLDVALAVDVVPEDKTGRGKFSEHDFDVSLPLVRED